MNADSSSRDSAISDNRENISAQAFKAGELSNYKPRFSVEPIVPRVPLANIKNTQVVKCNACVIYFNN